jgi:hypothetical protein
MEKAVRILALFYTRGIFFIRYNLRSKLCRTFLSDDAYCINKVEIFALG